MRKGLNSIKKGSEWSQNTCLCPPNGLRLFLKKCVFDQFFTQFCSENGPFSRNIGTSMGQNPSKWAQNGLKTAVRASQMVQDHFGKIRFGPIFDPLSSQNRPSSRHFGIFHVPKHITTASKWAKNTCLSIQNGPGSLLEKCVFDPFSTCFLSHNGPFSRHFAIFHGQKIRHHGLKTG